MAPRSTPSDIAAADADDEIFPQGVGSFDPTVDAVLLWTRVVADGRAPATVTWVVATDPTFDDVIDSGRVEVDADADRTAVVDVSGLRPSTTYWYRFATGGRHSPIGRTRTLPDGPTRHVRLATVSCAKFAAAPLTVYRTLAEHDVDLVVHLGDSIYEDGETSGPRPHDPPHAAVTLDDYRRRYAQLRSDPDARALHQRHPMVVMWDDHDIADNAWLGGAKAHDPERQGPWDDRVAAAARAHHEWLPARLRRPEDVRVRWRSLPLGDLAELVLLDTRYVGRDEQADASTSASLHDADRSLLGDEQRQWAYERIADRSRPWVLLASQVVVNPLTFSVPEFVEAPELLPTGYGVMEGQVLCTDEWDGYPAERDALVKQIDERGGGVVLLSGDVHSSWAFEGPSNAAGEPVTVEFTCPSVTSTPMGHQLPVGGGLLGRLIDDLHHVRFVDLLSFGYTVLDVQPDEIRAEWWFVDPEDVDARRRPGAAVAVRRSAPGRLVEVDLAEVDRQRIDAASGPVDGATDDGSGPPDLPARPDGIGRARARRERLLRTLAVVAAVVW
jgi:alkaline phosphatase D